MEGRIAVIGAEKANAKPFFIMSYGCDLINARRDMALINSNLIYLFPLPYTSNSKAFVVLNEIFILLTDKNSHKNLKLWFSYNRLD